MTPILRVKNVGLAVNTYLLPLGGQGACLMIDPGLDHEAIEAALTQHRLIPRSIVCTHGHFDHIASASRFGERFAIPVHLHTLDFPIAKRSNFMMMALKLRSRVVIPDSWASLEDGLGDVGIDVDVVHAPGHTPGSVVLRIGGAAFTGDTVFRDDTLQTKWPEHDQDRHVTSLKGLWDLLPDDTVIYPGHGRGATFGNIKERNAPLRRLVGLQR